ncbi:Serologically defined colon cancer antigen 1 [Fasciola gigantica]|uniref:Serologically defined colon cancer antigen 1 n=1 Tax=Fasciola gigantica TaxID=46835 RepID=A0A504YW66_FASGI|nr:Serologically defined colon cancer antigen 1 [Fasciola gigantica]
MPKLFRPKLTQAANKTTWYVNCILSIHNFFFWNCSQTTNVKSSTEETKTCSSSEKSNVIPEITNSTTSVSPSVPEVTSPLSVSLPQNEKTPEPHEELSSTSVQRPPIVSPKRLCINLWLVKRKRKAISSPESDHEKIELFKPKKPRITTLKHSLEPPPDPDQPLDRTTVSLRSLLNWVPINKPPPSYRQASAVKSENSDAAVGKSVKLEPPVFKTETAFQSPGKSSSTPPLDLLAPQLRLDADGNIVLDESSLLVSMPEVARDDSNVRHVNEETGLLNVTYNSFRNQRDRHGRRWSPQETVRFYRALTTFGRDFYLMATMFPNRSRAELKVYFHFFTSNTCITVLNCRLMYCVLISSRLCSSHDVEQHRY